MAAAGDNVRVRTFARAGCTEVFASATAPWDTPAGAVIARLERVTERYSAKLVRTGLHVSAGEPLESHQALGTVPDLVAYVWAVAGVEVKSLAERDDIVANSFSDGQAYYLYADLSPAGKAKPRADQARELFERMDALLRSCGMNFHNVVRTWFQLRHILEWYDEFNAVRNAFYAEQKLDWQNLPASTGIGALPPGEEALSGGLLALRPLQPDSRVQVTAVPSPQQGPAQDYGSAFSRAIEITAPEHRRLLISGTASIDERGATLHPRRFHPQMAKTFGVVRRLLESRGMGWADVLHGVAYIRRAEDIPALEKFIRQRGIPPIHVVPLAATVCRDDLLFELEIEAGVVT
jgi:enamine deaminase RidA (YjgF/YER057c/UK114 family)